jgi:hypothetical protein
MRRLDWRIKVAVLLVVLSAVLYWIHYALFGDMHHIWIYLIGDIAFLPVQVLLVTLLIDNLLSERERKARLKKMNMVIGAFFSEVGTPLMRSFRRFDPMAGDLATHLLIEAHWKDDQFAAAMTFVRTRQATIDTRCGDLVALRETLVARREFLLRLLENPNLLEHESFTDLLWATFHLTEELQARTDLTKSPQSDLAHLAGDIHRAYTVLLVQWLQYLRHLRVDYPYLYSLAVRTNPFHPQASVEVTD